MAHGTRTRFEVAALTIVMAAVLAVITAGPLGSVAAQSTPPDGLTMVSGSGQSARLSETFPDPLVVMLTEGGSPVAGEEVTFSVVSGPTPHVLQGGADVRSVVTVTTDAEGLASVKVYADDNPVRTVVNATWENRTVRFVVHAVEVTATVTVEGDAHPRARLLFDASGSVGNISSYVFDFGDGSVSRPMISPSTVHFYAREGLYLIRVTVHDERGIEDTVVDEVRIEGAGGSDAMSPETVWAIEALVLMALAAVFYSYGHNRLSRQIERIRSAEKDRSGDMFEMAVSHALAGDREMAITYFRKVLHDDPRNVNAHFYMGVVLMELRRYKAASAALRRALELDPDFEAAGDALKVLMAAENLGNHAGRD